jgi:hypothetical protein
MIELSDIAPSFSFIQHEGFVKALDHFRPEEFGNADLVMAGSKFSLKFERDRGQVFVDIGNSDIGWEKLEYALVFIDDSVTEEQLGAPPEVTRLAELAKSHWREIVQLYGDSANLSAFRDFCKMQSSAFISGIFSKS